MAYLTTVAEKQAKRDALSEVYDRAIAGETEIEIRDPHAGSVTYKNPDLNALRRRIDELDSQIAAAQGAANPRRRILIGARG